MNSTNASRAHSRPIMRPRPDGREETGALHRLRAGPGPAGASFNDLLPDRQTVGAVGMLLSSWRRRKTTNIIYPIGLDRRFRSKTVETSTRQGTKCAELLQRAALRPVLVFAHQLQRRAFHRIDGRVETSTANNIVVQLYLAIQPCMSGQIFAIVKIIKLAREGTAGVFD
jgi:hypothetical protein